MKTLITLFVLLTADNSIAQVTAGFNTKNIICLGNTAFFTNAYTGGGIQSFVWDFGEVAH